MPQVPCKFWQQGHCRFGDRCTFLHESGGGGASNNNRFAPQPDNRRNGYQGQNQGFHNTQNRPSQPSFGGRNELPYSLDKDQIITDLASERPQWILSAYGPGKWAPAQLFGGEAREKSFEEMRLAHYIATAAGIQPQAIQEAELLYQASQQQIQTILNDVDGAINYIIQAEKDHPNRLDIVKQGPTGTSQANPLNVASQTTGGAFGAPSQPAFGAPSGAFGQPSNLGQKPNPFGQPSALGQTPGPFGQPSSLGQNPNPFGQPSTLRQTASPVGQPSALGQKPTPFGAPSSAFGQPSSTPSPFGQPSAPSNTFGASSTAPGAFGQPSLPAANNAFGQPAANPLAQSSPFPFGAPSQAATSNPFGAPSQPAASNPFGAPLQPAPSNPFGAASQPPQTNGFAAVNQPFGGPSPAPPNPFGAPSQPTNGSFGAAPPAASNPFGNPSTNQPNPFNTQPAAPQPFGNPNPIAAAVNGQAGPQRNIVEYSSSGPNGSLTMFKGKRVVYDEEKQGQGKTPVPGIRNPDGTWMKIWFPTGAPMCKDTEMDEEFYDDSVKTAYQEMSTTGRFSGGKIPLIPPKREWCSWEF
ncbi:hypothetical protein HYALB_00009954 [Hymenoscyphus albidus]|uniref:C3H1-type domain-containing protein n=1 Tax=Hymenoscyphus albidus TaxID=595503 RepID=A0A9N9LWE0_9HELO|nr:hypothetical protein HYALB_00009954 [Hymenoscyphus albidus]